MCIGPSVFIGVASIIMPGVQIGEKAVVASMSFVNDAVPSFTLVGGQPAKILKTFKPN